MTGSFFIEGRARYPKRNRRATEFLGSADILSAWLTCRLEVGAPTPELSRLRLRRKVIHEKRAANFARLPAGFLRGGICHQPVDGRQCSSGGSFDGDPAM